MRSQVLINDAIYFIIPVLHVLLTSDMHANYITLSSTPLLPSNKGPFNPLRTYN
jgi:hypothetical protein